MAKAKISRFNILLFLFTTSLFLRSVKAERVLSSGWIEFAQMQGNVFQRLRGK